MAIKMRLVQRFQPCKKKEFMDLERHFAALEQHGTLPHGQRMTPIAGCQPANTFVWEGLFADLHEVEVALRLFDTNTAHVALFAQQAPLMEDAWVELYEVLDF
jgi:hypothetical protein